MHARIDFKEGDNVLVHWNTAAGKKRHRIETYEATMVEIDRAQGATPVQVKSSPLQAHVIPTRFGTGEAA